MFRVPQCQHPLSGQVRQLQVHQPQRTQNVLCRHDVNIIMLSIDFWSELQEEVQVDGTGNTISLPTVTIDGLPSSVVIERAIAMLKFRMVENTDTNTNNLDGDSMPEELS